MNSVYVIKNPLYPNLLKVGKSKEFIKRFASHNKSSSVPTPYEIIAVILIHGPEYHDVEADIHSRFETKRSGTKEFFEVSEEEVLSYCRQKYDKYQFAYSLEEYKGILESLKDTNCQSKKTGNSKKESEKVHEDRLIVTDYYKSDILYIMSPEPSLSDEEINLYHEMSKPYYPTREHIEFGIAEYYDTILQYFVATHEPIFADGKQSNYNGVNFSNLSILSESEIEYWNDCIDNKEKTISSIERKPGESLRMLEQKKEFALARIEQAEHLLRNISRENIFRATRA